MRNADACGNATSFRSFEWLEIGQLAEPTDLPLDNPVVPDEHRIAAAVWAPSKRVGLRFRGKNYHIIIELHGLNGLTRDGTDNLLRITQN